MIRDEELNRLVKYAQGMGLKVRFKPYVPYSKDAAEWTIDGTEMTVFFKPNESKISKILSFIHELGHHHAFINRGRTVDEKVEEALDSEEKRHRRTVLRDEIEGTKYWEDIYNNTNCKFSLEKLHKQMEFDIWTYEFYYENAKFPTNKEKKKKLKQLKDKYGC